MNRRGFSRSALDVLLGGCLSLALGTGNPVAWAAAFPSEKPVVDTRLARKIDVEMKGGDLRELTELLTQKSGVRFYVRKELTDDKLTVLARRQPVRTLMRQVARLFNLQWTRLGDETGKYRYELSQTLRQRLAEEERKRRDDDQMLLNVADELQSKLDDLKRSPEELKVLEEEAKRNAETAGSVEERERWKAAQNRYHGLSDPQFRSSLQLYGGLSPNQWVAIQQGQSLKYGFAGDGSENGLPREVAERSLQLFNDARRAYDKNWEQIPLERFKMEANLLLDRNRLDRADLKVQWTASVRDSKGNVTTMNVPYGLAQGQPDRMRRPDNAGSHAPLRDNPDFHSSVSLDPHSDAPSAALKTPEAEQLLKEIAAQPEADPATGDAGEWIDSADLFAEIHAKTGRNVIADYYTRVYPKAAFGPMDGRLLDLLNHAADTLQSEWREEDGFLWFRRFDYYTEREMDVSNSLLKQWQALKAEAGFLTLDELAEMASQPDRVLQHADLDRAMLLKYGFEEWPVARAAHNELRFYASLPPEGRLQAQTEVGVSLAGRGTDEIEKACKAMGFLDEWMKDAPQEARFHVHLRPAGVYEWVERKPPALFPVKVTLSEATREKAEAALETVLKAQGASPERIKSQKTEIAGPGMGVWSQLEAGGWYKRRVSSGHFVNAESCGDVAGETRNGWSSVDVTF